MEPAFESCNIFDFQVPPYVLVLMSVTSYRIHSIFILRLACLWIFKAIIIYPDFRLFNDPVAMILLYAAINLFIDDHWSLGSFCFSLAVNFKTYFCIHSIIRNRYCQIFENLSARFR